MHSPKTYILTLLFLNVQQVSFTQSSTVDVFDSYFASPCDSTWEEMLRSLNYNSAPINSKPSEPPFSSYSDVILWTTTLDTIYESFLSNKSQSLVLYTSDSLLGDSFKSHWKDTFRLVRCDITNHSSNIRDTVMTFKRKKRSASIWISENRTTHHRRYRLSATLPRHICR
jgi:hypothetical protein